jgi:two-component system sensor histidine kinase UhpB
LSSPPTIEVLLVEDSPTDALIIEGALADIAEFGCRVTHAELLADALRQGQARSFDVVLLDLGLPDAQGVDTFRTFRQYALDMPVIVLTGLSDSAVGVTAIQEGAQDYMEKREIEPRSLARILRYAIERHRVKAALAASEERFQLAVSGASAGLWDLDVRTGEMYMASHFREIIGYGEAELPGEQRAYQALMHPDDLPRVQQCLKAHIEHHVPFDVEYRIRQKSGEYRWIQSRGQALWDPTGEPYRMVGWIMDVTDRKRDLEALRTSREELQRLSTYIEHVREEEKTRIARELHDDLGQLLTALKIDMARFEQQLGPAKAPPLDDGLRKIDAVIAQLVASVRRIATDLRPVMLDDLGPVPALEWFIEEFTARHGIAVKTRLDMDEVAFNRDSGTEVFRMVQEALTNIARHSGASEACVEIVREPPHCVVRVADNGRGAPAGARAGRKSFGLLGMRERAARLGGELRVDTAPGRGFALTITLPLATVEAPDTDIHAAEAGPRGAGR